MRHRERLLTRRRFIATSALGLVGTGLARAEGTGARPIWVPFDGSPPVLPDLGRPLFLTPAERDTLGAIVERLIPADGLSVSGKDAGCVDFIDRQLTGGYGIFSGWYRQGPFQDGTPTQGDQSELNPRQRYRIGLADLDAHCRRAEKSTFAALSAERRDAVLRGLESNQIKLDGIPAKLFFEQVLQDTMEGFFADPIYGGNRDLVSWRMLGYPGARYDYSAYVNIGNKRVVLDPIGMRGGPSWTAGR